VVRASAAAVAADDFCQGGLGEPVDVLASLLVVGFDLAGDDEERVDAEDNFVLFKQRRNGYRHVARVRDIDARHSHTDIPFLHPRLRDGATEIAC
jgi:hypothetical protein